MVYYCFNHIIHFDSHQKSLIFQLHQACLVPQATVQWLRHGIALVLESLCNGQPGETKRKAAKYGQMLKKELLPTLSIQSMHLPFFVLSDLILSCPFQSIYYILSIYRATHIGRAWVWKCMCMYVPFVVVGGCA